MLWEFFFNYLIQSQQLSKMPYKFTVKSKRDLVFVSDENGENRCIELNIINQRSKDYFLWSSALSYKKFIVIYSD